MNKKNSCVATEEKNAKRVSQSNLVKKVKTTSTTLVPKKKKTSFLKKSFKYFLATIAFLGSIASITVAVDQYYLDSYILNELTSKDKTEAVKVKSSMKNYEWAMEVKSEKQNHVNGSVAFIISYGDDVFYCYDSKLTTTERIKLISSNAVLDTLKTEELMTKRNFHSRVNRTLERKLSNHLNKVACDEKNISVRYVYYKS